MQDTKKPYFMSNKDWYYVDDNWQIRIKKDAPEKAKESYREWIKNDNPTIDEETE